MFLINLLSTRARSNSRDIVEIIPPHHQRSLSEQHDKTFDSKLHHIPSSTMENTFIAPMPKGAVVGGGARKRANTDVKRRSRMTSLWGGKGGSIDGREEAEDLQHHSRRPSLSTESSSSSSDSSRYSFLKNRMLKKSASKSNLSLATTSPTIPEEPSEGFTMMKPLKKSKSPKSPVSPSKSSFVGVVVSWVLTSLSKQRARDQSFLFHNHKTFVTLHTLSKMPSTLFTRPTTRT